MRGKGSCAIKPTYSESARHEVDSEKVKVKIEKPTHRESINREEILATTHTSKKNKKQNRADQFVVFLPPAVFYTLLLKRGLAPGPQYSLYISLKRKRWKSVMSEATLNQNRKGRPG